MATLKSPYGALLSGVHAQLGEGFQALLEILEEQDLRLRVLEERLAIGKSAPRFTKAPYPRCKSCERVVFRYFKAAGPAHQLPLANLHGQLFGWAQSARRKKCQDREHIDGVLKGLMEGPHAVLEHRMAGTGYNVWLKCGAGISAE